MGFPVVFFSKRSIFISKIKYLIGSVNTWFRNIWHSYALFSFLWRLVIYLNFLPKSFLFFSLGPSLWVLGKTFLKNRNKPILDFKKSLERACRDPKVCLGKWLHMTLEQICQNLPHISCFLMVFILCFEIIINY